MDLGRLSGALNAGKHASHQRVAEYVRHACASYAGIGFGPREEWVAEKTVEALRLLLADTQCTDEERRAIEEFLALAGEEVPGLP
jgi:hypothetical protein